jgi:DNA invertase Pin-like site-specific DNA recombinase
VDLVGYLRVSSDGQLDGFGLETQHRAVLRWAKANGHRVVTWCRDEGVSGTTDAGDRPGLVCAVEAITKGLTEGVVVARLDRLARNLTVQEAALALFWKLGARVFAADTGEVLPDDPNDPMRTAIRQVFGVFAQLDRGLVTKRLRDGRLAKASTGRKAVGAYPYGFCGAGRGRHRDAVPYEPEQVALRRIDELRRSGCSFREIASRLDAEGLAPRRAGAWSPMAVRNIVTRSGPATK